MTEIGEEMNSCKYNCGVVCFPHERHCEKCGWCPKVSERRVKQFLKRANANVVQIDVEPN